MTRRIDRRQALGAFGTVSLGALLAGCGSDSVETTDGRTATVEPETTTSPDTALLLPGRRLARAADPARVDPRVRRALPDGRGELAREVARAMRRIEDEAARMGVLVEDLLTLARLDEIAEAPHTQVDLAVLAADAVEDARVTAPDREISLAADADAGVLGDAHQLRQVLGNLLRNALVHTPTGTSIEVAVRSRAATASEAVVGGDRGDVVGGGDRGDVVVLEVRDHGPGLPGGDPAAPFERFWRAESGRERGKGGAGLGLAIVAAIVEAHDGRVSAGDARGGGAVFTVVCLRRVAARRGSRPSRPARGPPPRLSAPAGGHPRARLRGPPGTWT
jgi:signal transduction histidine kinase